MKFRCLAAFMVAVIISPLTTSSGAWNDPTNAQYHIQTDEGPERYFRYQTQSGQYRKEKRLEDGTVIGTYAWIDSDGMLRLRDYIADNAGYRILRSKNLYVGVNSPIDQAIKAAKKAPVNGGVLATANQGGKTPIINFHYRAPQAEVKVPQVEISPNSYLPAHVTTLVTSTPSPLIPQSGSESVIHIPSTTPLDVSIPSTTPSPIYSTNQPTVYETSTPSSVYLPQPGVSSPSSPISSAYLPQPVSSSPQPPLSSAYLPQPATSSPSPPLSSNSVEYPGFSGAPQYEHYTDNFVNPYIYQNGPTYPIDKNGHTFNGHTNKIGNGYNPQYPQYDGISVTNDGFRYYIPRAYHEEQNLPGERKSGSFGYIDPFGIRRVVYYNAGPGTGFQHRKNNRYVGFNATPYDPRPY